MPTDPDWPPPDYCCAILEDRRGRLLLQRRGPDARRAANRVTCLGGSREADEPPDDCIRRELAEEIGHVPARLDRRLVLVVEGKLVAWFYRGGLAVAIDELVLEPGLDVLLAGREELADLPMHPWHKAAIEAEARGEARLVVPATPPVVAEGSAAQRRDPPEPEGPGGSRS